MLIKNRILLHIQNPLTGTGTGRKEENITKQI